MILYYLLLIMPFISFSILLVNIYQMIKCRKIYNCYDDKCIHRERCPKACLTEEEKKIIKEMIDKMEWYNSGYNK